MKNPQEQLEALNDIRQMMKQSNRFLSLSGLSGIFAGVYALIGAYFGSAVISGFDGSDHYDSVTYAQMLRTCIIICILVLGCSLATAFLLSARKAKQNGQKLFDHTAIRLVINLMIPLGAGGIFCLAMLYHGDSRVLVIGPGMLIFYGLALVNGSKYTLHDLRYLGCMEILLGLIACVFPGYGLVFWAIGFGVLHIIYGAYMWFKYERG